MCNIDLSNIVSRLGLEKGKYIVVSAHREENIDISNHFKILCESLDEVAHYYQMPIIFSTHPRTRKRIASKNISFHTLVQNIEPLGFFDYVALQKNAFIVLSDSGTISEESAMCAFPAVSIRTSTERPEAVDAGTIVLGGIRTQEILNAIHVVTTMNSFGDKGELPKEYDINNCSERIVRLIQSYTSIVDNVIWNKSSIK
jgi:UDP-N-acetylglucosamine 2-epimerase (non-hydrolysing)